LELLAAGDGRQAFVGLSFSGREDRGQSMRSNRSGLGTHYIARAGNAWVSGFNLPQDRGGDLQPESIALNGLKKMDYLEIDWSDGVFQTELGLEVGQTHQLVETQRQLASCPVIFAWNGHQYEFVSDVLGVGGLGFAVGREQYATPRPWEKFRLEESQLQADEHGFLKLKIAEPMEEIAYIDQLNLTVVDIPPGWGFVLDERLATSKPDVTGEMLWYRHHQSVRHAVNQSAQLVTNEVRLRDLVASPPGSLDTRFLGLLENEQSLTFDFEVELNELNSVALLIHGWVEYGYSQTSFAAWQAGISYEAASLDLMINGQWQTYRPSFGYPAGMPRQAVLPLGQLPANTEKMRLRSNQQIYWDQIGLIELEAKPEYIQQKLRLIEAKVETIGFPKRTTGHQWQPHYDYSQRQAFWDTKYPAGFYTALGPADQLVESKDGALAVIGPGDALSLSFKAPERKLDQGWTRAYVLSLDGWAKDMDLYTRDGETVEPLPGQHEANPKSIELHARYNTRYRSGR